MASAVAKYQDRILFLDEHILKSQTISGNVLALEYLSSKLNVTTLVTCIMAETTVN